MHPPCRHLHLTSSPENCEETDFCRVSPQAAVCFKAALAHSYTGLNSRVFPPTADPSQGQGPAPGARKQNRASRGPDGGHRVGALCGLSFVFSFPHISVYPVHCQLVHLEKRLPNNST